MKRSDWRWLIGASFAGVRALATMKHVGLNVASDPLFTASYTGVRGGLVVITADDPEMHSSQNEQDNRNYAFAAKLPMFEPSDPAEAREMLARAFEAERTATIPRCFSGSRPGSPMSKGWWRRDNGSKSPKPSIEKMPGKFVMLPGPARSRRAEIEKRMAALRDLAETLGENMIEAGTSARGFITSGTSYNYVKEAFPEAAVLKLGMVWPLPGKEDPGFCRHG